MRSKMILVLTSILFVSACQENQQEVTNSSVDVVTSGISCADIASAEFANTEIHTAVEIPAGEFVPPSVEPFGPPPDFSGLPAFCRVAGSIKPTAESDIRFELWMPVTDWNGRFMQTGNGGAAGSIVYGSLVMPLSRGYAVAHTDTGHRGQFGEFSWAVGQPEKLVDYQYRAVRELTLVGKAITTAHFAQPIEKSYWLGCSTGGRQGLKEAQRFPEDYDAIIAGAPANNWSPLMSLAIHIEANLGPGGLSPAKLGVLNEAAIAACDSGDGVSDRVIGSPEGCNFDPAQLQCEDDDGASCLTASEVDAARRIYEGVLTSSGETVMPGTGPGSEPEWGGYASPGFRIGSSYFRHVIKNDDTWQATQFEVDADLAAAETQDAGAAKAMDPDLSGFVANGGKLMIYHGTTDGLIPYGNSVNYYNDVVETMGVDAVEDHVKLYLVPGMAHCFGGEGAYLVDWLTAMERWAEDGVSPDNLLASHPPEPGEEAGGFTRPVCAYPGSATYGGIGAKTEASSYECK